MERKWSVCFLLMVFISITTHSQLGFSNNSDAVNLQAENLDLNFMISVSSPNGNTERRIERLKKISPKSMVYKVSNALQIYYLEGPQKSFEYVENVYKGKSSKKEEKWFLHSFVSLVIGNLDDYSEYSRKLNPDSFFKLRLEIKEITQQYRRKKEVQKQLVKKMDKLLQEKQLSDSQALFLKLCKIDFEDDIAGYSGDYDKYTPVISLWREKPDQFDDGQLLRYLNRCETSECKKVSKDIKNRTLKNSEGLLRAFDLMYARDRENGEEFENQLRKIITNESKGIQKEKLKSMILAADKEYQLVATWEKDFAGMFINFSRIELDLSNEFKAELVSTASKEDLITEAKKIADRQGIGYEKFGLETLNQQESQIALGGVTIVTTLASQIVESVGPAFKVKSESVSKEYRDDWNAFVKYVEKDPLYNNVWDASGFITIPELDTKQHREAALRAFEPLVKRYPNSLNMARWKFWLLFQDEKLYEFDVKNCELYLKTIIQIFALNQSEGRPGQKNKQVSYYTYGRNLPEFTYSDDDFLPEMKKRLGSEKWSSIVEYLEDQMNLYPRNANLRALHIKIMEQNGDPKLYFDSYLAGITTIDGLPSYNKRFAGDIDESYGKKRLLDAYQNTIYLENHADLVFLYYKYGFIKEAVSIMSYDIKDIPWYPNKETFFVRYYKELIKYVQDVKQIQQLLEVVYQMNREVGIIHLYLMMYDLVQSNEENALKRLESSVAVQVIHSKYLNSAFDIAIDNSVDYSTLENFKNKLEEKFPGYFDKKRW